MSLMVMRSNQKICQPCVNSYSSLANRWKTNKNLKLWWASLGEVGQADWYRKQHGSSNMKRKFENIGYSESSSHSDERTKHAVGDMIPLNIFIRRKTLEGLSAAMATQEFQRLVDDKHTLAEFTRGQWHVPDYQGLQRKTGETDSTMYKISRGGAVDNLEQLSEYLASAEQQSANMSRHLEQASELLAPPPPPSAVKITGDIRDQPTIKPVEQPMLELARREVGGSPNQFGDCWSMFG
jgi:hypothetical protein